MSFSALDKLRIPNRIKQVLAEFARRVREVLDPDARIYLFGSYAKGTWLSDSDLDLIVVSRRFQGLKLRERYVMVRELLPDDISVELLLYTPEEFERLRRRSVVLQDAAEYWVEL